MIRLLPIAMLSAFSFLLPAAVSADDNASGVFNQSQPLLLAAADANARKEELAAAISKAARTFVVTVEEKTPQHPFYGKGHKIGMVIDGVQGKELVLTRGVTYAFDVETNIQHDFYFTTEEKGWGGGTITNGVLGQFTFKGMVAFTPNQETPSRMYYGCRNHPYMGGLIHVINEGEKVTLEHNPEASAAVSVAPVKVSETDVKQKISFAKMLMMSQAAQRVSSSGNSEAVALMSKARNDVADAEASLTAGDTGKAMTAAKAAAEDANAAIAMVPKEAAVDHATHYAELLGNLRNFKESYIRQYEGSSKAKREAANLDPKTLQKMEDDAVALSTQGKYKDANELLEKAQHMITVAMSKAFSGEEISYEQTFKSPAEEYQFEVSRYKSFADLVPVAIEQKQPTESAVQMINSFVEKGEKIAGEAKDYAKKGDYATAILGMQEATKQIQRALMIAGVR